MRKETIISKSKEFVFSLSLIIISTSISLVFVELVIRSKNSKMNNYDVEMWRYANQLKQKSTNTVLDFEHIKDKKVNLQNVLIRLNKYGLRGKEVKEKVTDRDRRILFLGGSITLGWGVDEEKTLTSVLEKKFLDQGQNVEVLNAGVGNYNAERYITRFFKDLKQLKPSDIVVNYFLRDAENLKPSKPNFILKNSQTALTAWTAFNKYFRKSGIDAMENHYKEVYISDSPGFMKMKVKLKDLSDYAKKNNIKIYLLMTPDIHNLIDYKYNFIHEKMNEIAKEYDYEYIDPLPKFLGKDSITLFAMPGDPHPNSEGHKIMADSIFPFLYKSNP